MAVEAKVVNKADVIAKLGRLSGEQARTAMTRTMRDVQRRGPAWIAKVATSVYAVPATKLNPNTKAGAGKASVAAGGETLAGVTWTYVGERLTMGGTFKLRPAAHRNRPYQLTGQILKGVASPYGHWSKPYSEGGRYGPVSPWMLVSGVNVPIQRTGQVFGGAAKGLAVPQMVLSDRTKDQLQQKLEEETLKRLEHYVEQVLGT